MQGHDGDLQSCAGGNESYVMMWGTAIGCKGLSFEGFTLRLTSQMYDFSGSAIRNEDSGCFQIVWKLHE